MKHWQATLAASLAVLASIALADDFTTLEGKEYRNVTVSRVEPDGIVLSTKTGISKVYFVELPKEVKERFLPSPPRISVKELAMNKLKNWAATMANPSSLVLFFVGLTSLIVAGLFAIIRGRQ